MIEIFVYSTTSLRKLLGVKQLFLQLLQVRMAAYARYFFHVEMFGKDFAY